MTAPEEANFELAPAELDGVYESRVMRVRLIRRAGVWLHADGSPAEWTDNSFRSRWVYLGPEAS